MVLESTMICVDNSEYMRNGDFIPSRLQAQQDAVNLICHSKTRANPENNVGLLTMANTEVLATLTTDTGKIMAKLQQLTPNGIVNFMTGIRVAHLALKHRQGKNHRPRIIAFVGSPLEVDSKDLVRLAKRLKKEKVNVDIINFGEAQEGNNDNLKVFIETLSGKEGGGSHLATMVGGDLVNALMGSPIVKGDDETGGISIGPGSGFEFGVDPNEDPELALALRVSMEEQRQRQEEEARRAQAESAAASGIKPAEENTEEALLEKALAMSVEHGSNNNTPLDAGTSNPAGFTSYPDFASMTEEEQIAYAMQMSMQEAQQLPAAKVSDEKQKEKEQPPPEHMEVEEHEEDTSYREVVRDPMFLQSVLETLPGVDPQSETVRSAVGSLTKQADKHKEKDKGKEKEKDEEKQVKKDSKKRMEKDKK
ncbi:unnamed protein product [Darwinula stevensoni]|uniref:26S proteasome non-ATPase regulatory subunit 4 n=1 Tax=Darwinula stevensoni TaxID=69355 RepID=A0A7R8X2T5_9CRUS|nr:unnamed protein product [Darwinula stevensoni]CAG0881580.1 unnamed protein product [Darwinula stevensoni]